MAHSVSEERLVVVLAVIAAGADCAASVKKATGYSVSSVFNALEVLRARKQIEYTGTRAAGGADTRVFRVVDMAAVRPGEAAAHKSRLNGHRHHANAGLTDLVRSHLRRDRGLTAEEVARNMGRPTLLVMGILQQLATITGGVVAEGPRLKRTYRLYTPTEQPDATDETRPFRKAGRIVHGRGAYWGAGLV